MCVCVLVCRSSSAADIPVFYVNHPTDSVLALGCPEARPNLAVAWDQGSTAIYRSEHTANSSKNIPNPRLKIDSGHHLVFNPAKMEDSGRSQRARQIGSWQWILSTYCTCIIPPDQQGSVAALLLFEYDNTKTGNTNA